MVQSSHNTQISNGIKTSSLVCSVSKCSLHFSLKFLEFTVVNFQKTDIYKLKSVACFGWTSKPKQIFFPPTSENTIILISVSCLFTLLLSS